MRLQIFHWYSLLRHWALGILIVAAVPCSGCRESASQRNTRPAESSEVRLVFRIELNQHVYEDSLWGDPPQLAIWLQNQVDQSIRMVQVTHRTAACDWVGKVECCVALPYWVMFYNRQKGTDGPPTWENPAIDAITCATPKAQWTTDIQVPQASRWTYFVEVNVSGDFNPVFPRLSQEGLSDRYGNGQPSLVYEGQIEAIEGAASQPRLAGRTDQYEPIDQIVENTEGITTAKELLREISVYCRGTL